MRSIPTNRLRSALHRLNLKPRVQGNGTGHEVWTDSLGRTCKPVLRKKDVNIASLFSLGLEMESKGIIDRKTFMREVLG
jgi:hypothetical protein